MRFQTPQTPWPDPPHGVEETTGLGTHEPTHRVAERSGKSGQKFEQEGDAWGDEPHGDGVADWHGEWEVPGAPGTLDPNDPSRDTDPATGASGGSHEPTDVEPISPHGLESAQRDLTMALLETARKITSYMEHDHNVIGREVPARRGVGVGPLSAPVAASGTPPIHIVSADPGRRRLIRVNEDPTNFVRYGHEREYVEQGQGTILFPKTSVELKNAGDVWVAANTAACLVSAYVEDGQPWQVPKFGKFTESNRDVTMPHRSESSVSFAHRNRSREVVGARP